MPRSFLVSSLLIALSLLTGCPDDGGGADSPPDAGITNPPDARPPSCTNGVFDPGEDKIDCGGSCPTACPVSPARCRESGCPAGETCQSTGERAQACRPIVTSCAGDPCGPDAICELGWDDQDHGVAYCARRLGSGELCDPHYDKDVDRCEAGLRCQADRGSSDHHCAPAPADTRRAEGVRCDNSSDCGNGLSCSATFGGRCVKRAAEGEPCIAGESSCGVGLICDMPDGLRCTSWVDCGSQRMCCGVDGGGAECRVFDGQFDHWCAPPTGTCVVETVDNRW